MADAQTSGQGTAGAGRAGEPKEETGSLGMPAPLLPGDQALGSCQNPQPPRSTPLALPPGPAPLLLHAPPSLLFSAGLCKQLLRMDTAAASSPHTFHSQP